MNNLKSLGALGLWILLVLGQTGGALAVDGSWSDNPVMHSGLSGKVAATAIDDSGRLYVGGNFVTADSIAVNRVAFRDAATEQWQAMGSGVNGSVAALVTDIAGNLYAGGTFTVAGGTSVSNIARWNAASESWEAMGAETGGPVQALAIDSAGRLYAARSEFGDSGTRSNILRWSESSQEWEALGSGMDGPVYALTTDDANRLYAGGTFSTAGGVPADNVALWKPQEQRWEPIGAGVGEYADDQVRALVVDSAGNLYAAGYFNTAGGVDANSIARWNVSTQRWESLGTGIVATRWNPFFPYENDLVHALAVDGEDNIYAGGEFIRAGDQQTNAIARWNASTRRWERLSSGLDRYVYAMSVGTDGKVFTGGWFGTAGGLAASNIASWSPVMQTWQSFGSGIDNGVSAIATDSVGNMYAAMNRYHPVQNKLLGSVARRNLSSGRWENLGTGMNGTVSTVVVDSADNVFVAGGFTSADGTAVNRIARWDSSSERWLALGSGLDGGVSALTTDPAGNIYAGGWFSSAGGIALNGVARWNAAEQIWEAMGNGLAGVDGVVSSLATDSGGNVVAAGLFRSPAAPAGDTTWPQWRVARWNVDSQTWQDMGLPAQGVVEALATDSFGNVFLARRANSGAIYFVSRWNAANQRWDVIGEMNASVKALSADSAGHLYAGGRFTSIDGQPSNYIARWNWVNQDWEPLNSGLDGDVGFLFADRSSSIHAAGGFSTAGGKASPGIAIWNPQTAPVPALNIASHRWKQLSLPCNPGSSNTVAKIFGDDRLGDYGSTWMLWSFDSLSNAYQAVTEQSQLAQGQAYWFVQLTGSTRQIDMPSSCSVTPQKSACPDDGGCFEVPLAGNAQQASFQMIGYPYAVSSSLDDAYIVTDTSDCAQGCRVGTAAANRYLNPYLFTFDGVAYQIARPGGAFSDWAGYWALVMPAAADSGARLSFVKRPGSGL